MYIAMGIILVKKVLPRLWALSQAAIGPVMTLGIAISGIVIIFGAVGMKVSTGLGSSIVNWIGRAIAAIFKGAATIVKYSFWPVRRIFIWCRAYCIQKGMSNTVATVIAIVAAAVLI